MALSRAMYPARRALPGIINRNPTDSINRRNTSTSNASPQQIPDLSTAEYPHHVLVDYGNGFQAVTVHTEEEASKIYTANAKIHVVKADPDLPSSLGEGYTGNHDNSRIFVHTTWGSGRGARTQLSSSTAIVRLSVMGNVQTLIPPHGTRALSTDAKNRVNKATIKPDSLFTSVTRFFSDPQTLTGTPDPVKVEISVFDLQEITRAKDGKPTTCPVFSIPLNIPKKQAHLDLQLNP